MRVTFITGHLCKERHALLYELALDLGENGADVTVITGYPSRRISKEVRQYYLDHPIEQISSNVIVKRVGTKRGEGNGLLSRMIKYFFLTRKLYKTALKIETDVFYLYSSPFFLGYIGTKLNKKAPTIYNAQDLFPDTLVHIRNLSENNPLIRYFRKRETEVYQKNAHIITISNQMKKTIVENGGCPENVSVIYNWADINRLHHVEKKNNGYFEEFGIDRGHFIISYAGDLGLFQGWDVILDAAKVLKDKLNDIEFVLIGNGSYKSKILERINAEAITNVRVFPLQPANRLSEVYSLGDVELLPIEKGITKMALPSKSGVIMATGNPLLAIVDLDSDICDIVRKNNIGLCCSPGDLDGLVKNIIFLRNHRDDLPRYGLNARLFAKKSFARKLQTKKYFDVLKEKAHE